MSLYPEDVPFHVVKENWCTWDLGNDCILKIKLVVAKIMKPGGMPLDQVREFKFHQQSFISISSPIQVKGAPETKPLTHELIEESIIEDIDPRPLTKDGNEYTLENGTIVRFSIMLTRVARTDIFSADGTPVYAINHQIVPQIILPKKKRRRRSSPVV